jgi:murein DD-endopeptidase MepM/ murein hydrolase activator NlpD
MWAYPLPKQDITAGFNEHSPARRALGLGPHRGVDFKGANNVISAVTAGVVDFIQWSDVLGWVMNQKTDDGWYVGYCHLSCNTHGQNCKGPAQGCRSPYKSLRVGQRLTLGQAVGRVGNTGSASTGPHLHITLSKAKRGVFSGKVYDIAAHIEANSEYKPKRCPTCKQLVK